MREIVDAQRGPRVSWMSGRAERGTVGRRGEPSANASSRACKSGRIGATCSSTRSVRLVDPKEALLERWHRVERIDTVVGDTSLELGDLPAASRGPPRIRGR